MVKVVLVLSSVLFHGGARADFPAEYLTTQAALAPRSIPMFVNALPVLEVPGVPAEPLWESYPKIATVLPSEVAAATDGYTLKMCEFKANVLPPGTALPGVPALPPGVAPETHVWGYSKGSCPAPGEVRDTYLGPVFVSLRGQPTAIRFVNELPLTAQDSNVIAYRDSVDQTLHWANPEGRTCGMPPMAGMEADPCASPFRDSAIPAVPHLHGGEVPPMLDGGPDAWFTSSTSATAKLGPAYYTDPSFAAGANEAVYRYPNTQEAAPLWFHDHTLGATRLNVYAGLAGGYVLVDPLQDVPESLKDPSQIVPVIIQDRMFDTNGELFFTSGSKGGVLWALNPEHPYWNPEFVGDTIAVNGKVWPFLEVEPKRYRFLFLNGSNARTYELFLVDRLTKVMGPAMHLIGTDGGYLDAAVRIDPNAPKGLPQRLVIMPGERYEVLVDFSALPPGTNLWLKNVARTPYPGGETPTGGMDKVMELRVTCPAAPTPCPSSGGIAYDPQTTPQIRGTPMTKLVEFGTGVVNATIAKRRLLTLNEVMGPPVAATDPVTGQLTAFPGGPLEVLVNNSKWSAAPTELPNEGETEIWEIVNLTADSHPMHLHLVQFQLLGRQKYDLPKYDAVYGRAFPRVDGSDGQPLMIGMNRCSGGVYCPGYGPPTDYFTPIAGKLGGNPDVAPFLKGPRMLASPQERGWKDTIQVPPGMVTRLAVRWAPTDLDVNVASEEAHFPFDPSGDGAFGYVWHCHIIDHEDNEMMRPDYVQLNPLAPAAGRDLVQGTDY